MTGLESTRIVKNITIVFGEYELVLDIVIATLVEGWLHNCCRNHRSLTHLSSGIEMNLTER